MGGVTAFFMYPAAVDGPEIHNQRFLSPEFLATLHHAAARARELNLRFGVAGGTGWPFGGPTVALEDAAQQVRQVPLPLPPAGATLRLPELRERERVLAVFAGTNEVTREAVAGRFLPKPGERLIGFITGPTGMQVKRSAFGAEGLVLDHYQASAARRYLEAVADPMLKAAPGLIESIFCDSLEVYRANWTGDFAERFRKARGYSIVSALPEMLDETSAQAANVRFDYWRTLAETTESQFTQTLSDWAHHHHVRLEMEAYGTPPNPLTAARYIDVPTGEQYEWRGFSLCRLAASGAHLAGRNVVGAEAWTWLGLPNRLGDSLSDAKLCSDLHFLAGVNDLTGVDFAYSPRSAGAPGWLPYYGPVFNQNNPQWPWFKELVTYASRCQWMLRQGKPVANVALYLPVEDKFAFGSTEQMLLGFELRDHFVSGPKTGEFGLQTALHHHSDLIDSLFARGFNFDGLDFFSLIRNARVRNGHLLAGDGDYTILILPRVIGIEKGALAKIVDFCQSGGIVLATGRLPERIYENAFTPSTSGKQNLVKLFGRDPDRSRSWERTCGRGRVLFVPDEAASLQAALSGFPSDIEIEPPLPEVGFVHRRLAFGDLYFLCNTSEQPCHFNATCRTRATRAQAWNALSGEKQTLGVIQVSLDQARTRVELPPRSSLFLVFGAGSATGEDSAPAWQTQEIKGDWHLTFAGINAPADQSLTRLASWTESPDARFYSGVGTYTTVFDWAHPIPQRALLEFSELHAAAEVTLNGEPAGTAWTPPLQIDVTRRLIQGSNTLTIRVGNLPLNLFLGSPDPDLAELRKVYGNRFPAPEEKRQHPDPAPSGITGPIFLRFVESGAPSKK